MTNKISSAEEAISALNSIQEMSTTISVNLAFPNTCFSIHGKVIGVDESALQISAIVGNDLLGTYQISPLSEFDFIGGFHDAEDVIHFYLAIVRKGKFDQLEIPRTNLSAQWPKTIGQSKSVN
jgi:hypothetical protein